MPHRDIIDIELRRRRLEPTASTRHFASGIAVPQIELRGITKRYPGCLANDSVDLRVMPGEVHALLGENGAGKSTLAKVIYGVVKADAGEVFWEGRRVDIRNPAHVRRLGIGMIFQHFNLFDTLTVTENVALGVEDSKDLKAVAQRITGVSDRYGLSIDPQRHVHALSVGERQRVEITRCLLQSPKLLIMDEPTSVLTPQEVNNLFKTLRRLAQEGCSILYISHKLGEIKALCQTATVLRGGKVTAVCDPREETPRSLAKMMFDVEPPVCEHANRGVMGNERLLVDGLSLPSGDPFGTDLKDVRLSVYGGEIMGIAGVAGNGQKELLAALSGERVMQFPNAVRINGRAIGHLGPSGRRIHGLGYSPEERLGRGAVAELTVSENALLTGYCKGLVKNGFMIFAKIREFAVSICRAFNVVCAGTDAEAKSLSGGNLQKFIIGREILLGPKLLIAAHPTSGLDVGAAVAIRQALIDLKNAGAAILLASEDLDELFELCDKIAVISNGRLSPAKPTAETDIEEVGLLMSGMFDAVESQTSNDAA